MLWQAEGERADEEVWELGMQEQIPQMTGPYNAFAWFSVWRKSRAEEIGRWVRQVR